MELAFYLLLMSKTVRKRPLTIIAATGMTIFSLLVVFVAAIAWFAMNKQTNANGMNLSISSIRGRLSKVHFHSFVSGQSSESTFSFSKTPFVTYEYDWDSQEMVPDEDDVEDAWNMGDYDFLNKNHPFLVLFEFDQDYVSAAEGDIFIKGVTTVGGDTVVNHYAEDDVNEETPIYTTGGGFLGARAANGSPYYSLPQTQVKDESHPERILIKQETRNNKTYDYYALSSVASFRNKAYSSTQYSSISSGSYISISTSTLERDESFIAIDNEANRYLFKQTPYLYKSNGTETVKYIALVVEYSQDAISYIFSTYLGDSGLNRYDSILYFACDWSLEVD